MSELARKVLPLRTKIWLIILLIVVAAYQILFSAPVVSWILRMVVPPEAELRVEVSKSSLFFGFVFDHVVLKDRLSGDPVFTADQVRLRWFLPGILAGQIGVREIGLRNPSVSLIRRNGRWNTDALGTEKHPEKTDTSTDSSSLPEAIELYLPVRLYGAVHIEGFRFLREDHSDRTLRRVNVSDVDLHLSFVTKTFHSIPLNLDALQLFDSLFFALNPIRPVQFEYLEFDRIYGKPVLMMKLYRETSDNGTAFLSRLRIDTRDLSHSRSGIDIPFGLRLTYDIHYDPARERILIRSWRLEAGQDTWLSLTGDFRRDKKGYHYIDLRMHESNIDLDRIRPLVQRLTSSAFDMGGRLSLYPFTITGRLDSLSVHFGLSGSNVYLRTGTSSHSIPSARIDMRATVNLYALGLLSTPEDYTADSSLAYGFVREASVDSLELGYNGAVLTGKGSLHPAQGIVLDLDLRNFSLGQFTAPQLVATGSADLRVRSGTDFRRLTTAGWVRLDALRYQIDRSLSGLHNLMLDADLDIVFQEHGTRIIIIKADLTGTNVKGASFLRMLASGELTFAEGQSYTVRLSGLDINYENLNPLLPGNLQSDLASLEPYLEGGAHLDGNAQIHMHHGTSVIQASASFILPSVSAEGIHLEADLNTAPDGIRFHRMHLDGLRGALNADLTGSFLGPPEARQPYLDFRLNLSRKGMLPVHENLQIDGIFDISARIRPEQIEGNIDIRRFNLIYSNKACVEKTAGCTHYYIEDLNFALPFVHRNQLTPIRYETMVNPDLIDRFPDRPNLTLKSIWSNRSPDGLIVDQGFYFLGAPAAGTRPALEASLTYRQNILESRLLRISTYRPLKSGEKTAAPVYKSAAGKEYVSNGTLEVRNLFFNVADLKPESMEYGAYLSIHDLNVEPYFPKAGSSYDGVISATANVRGANLADPLRNLNARLAVYRISKDFTGLAVRIMVPSDILARIVNNTLEIPSMSAELRGGLVYTTIQVRSSGVISLSRLVKPADEMIRQERIPLAEFLERTRREAGEFQ
jgi:hypothetical protein